MKIQLFSQLVYSLVWHMLNSIIIRYSVGESQSRFAMSIACQSQYLHCTSGNKTNIQAWHKKQKTTFYVATVWDAKILAINKAAITFNTELLQKRVHSDNGKILCVSSLKKTSKTKKLSTTTIKKFILLQMLITWNDYRGNTQLNTSQATRTQCWLRMFWKHWYRSCLLLIKMTVNRVSHTKWSKDCAVRTLYSLNSTKIIWHAFLFLQ